MKVAVVPDWDHYTIDLCKQQSKTANMVNCMETMFNLCWSFQTCDIVGAKSEVALAVNV